MVIMTSFWILFIYWFQYIPRSTGSSEHHPTSRIRAIDRATPPPYGSPRCSRRKKGAATQLGERAAGEDALPGAGFSVRGKAGDRKNWKSQYDAATNYCVYSPTVVVRTGLLLHMGGWMGR